MNVPDRKRLQILFSPAPTPPNARAWPKLIEAIRQASAKRHIYLTAKPGPGRTASVSRWLEEIPGRKAWVTLDEGGNAPDKFFTRLALAFLSLQPDNSAIEEKLRRAGTDGAAPALAWDAAYCLTAEEKGAVLVLDGFEIVTDEVIIRELTQIIRVLPDGFSVVIIGKDEPHALFSDLILRNLMSVLKEDHVII